MSYGVFAQFYDLFTKNVDYAAYAGRVDDIVTSLGLKRGSLVDLGCGTASLDIELAKLGYDVTGIDISCDMLTAAYSKVCASGAAVRLVNQDMTRFSLPGKADVILSSLDGLNHLDSMEEIKKTFARVKKYLVGSGAFIFDMNTVYKHKNVLADNAFIFDSDEAYLGWQNDLCGDGSSVIITLDFFIPEGDGYIRATEQFTERAYPVEDVLSALAECGLETVGIYDGLSREQISDSTQRVLFVAKKK